jgi:F-type H+-transporting ATPase subunit a
MQILRSVLTFIFSFFLLVQVGLSKDDHGDTNSPCFHEPDTIYNPGATAFHHISDQNIYSIGPWHFNLPCFLYAPETGWSFFSSGKFHAHQGHHGEGEMAYEKYVLQEGIVKRVVDPSFPMGEVKIDGLGYRYEIIEGKEKEIGIVCYEGKTIDLDQKSTADFGLFGGGITSFYDFSITKNVLGMLLVCLFLGWVFLSVAKMYRKREGQAPKGLQGFMEPLYNFIKDDVAQPMIGHKYEKFMPFIMALFFFILGLNMFGQIPFLGNANVTGNLAVTAVLAIFTFIITNINGNGHYWQHIFWMPGIPWPVKLLMTPIEILGLFLKPFTLLVRLFANITAGHIVVLSFVGLIFIFGNLGTSVLGGYGGAVVSVLLTLFMSAIELLVAFIQAFIFAILSASYIGAAVADDHH